MPLPQHPRSSFGTSCWRFAATMQGSLTFTSPLISERKLLSARPTGVLSFASLVYDATAVNVEGKWGRRCCIMLCLFIMHSHQPASQLVPGRFARSTYYILARSSCSLVTSKIYTTQQLKCFTFKTKTKRSALCTIYNFIYIWQKRKQTKITFILKYCLIG